MATNYSIRIDFDREQENPQRVFIAMAMYIEGFNALQESFMQGFGKGIEFDTSLEKTREGSCIADIAIKVKDIIRGVRLESLYDCIYEGIKKEISTSEKIDSETDVKTFIKNVYSASGANSPQDKLFTCHGDADPINIADALNKIYKANSELSKNDKVQFGRGDDLTDISETFSCPRNGSQIFSNTVEDFPAKEILIVRRPSYVKGLQWDFERTHGKNKKITAAMLDDVWFEKWVRHEDVLWPGDALHAYVRTKRKTNKLRPHLASYEKEIVKVIRVVPQGEVQQLGLELDHE